MQHRDLGASLLHPGTGPNLVPPYLDATDIQIRNFDALYPSTDVVAVQEFTYSSTTSCTYTDPSGEAINLCATYDGCKTLTGTVFMMSLAFEVGALGCLGPLSCGF